MPKGFVLFLGLVMAVALYSLLGRLEPTLIIMINTFSILVFWSGVVYGETYGAVMGTCAGLVQDAFSSGVFGLAALSLTVAGFLAGYLSRKLDLNSFYKRTIFIFFLSLIQIAIWLFFYFFIFRKSLLYTQPALYLQPVVTAFLSGAVITIFKKFTRMS